MAITLIRALVWIFCVVSLIRLFAEISDVEGGEDDEDL